MSSSGSPIAGWRALVTGASSGIGLEIARALAARGANLVLVARRKERLDTLAAELRDGYEVEVEVRACDLADAEATEALLRDTAELPIDILVNNAGLGRYDHLVNCEWGELHKQIEVNMTALTRLTHHYVPAMVERGRGHVMNVASIAAYVPTPNFAVYSATKAYVQHLSEALDHELSGTGVRVICVNPGGTKTEFMDQAQQTVKPGGDRLMMSAAQCAEIAVSKMLAGRRTVVTGLMNAVGMFLLRFVPRRAYPGLADRAMRQAVDKR